MSKGGRLSRLFPKLFRSDRDKNEVHKADGKNPTCLILFLDDIEQRVSYKTNWKGQVLFDLVCGQVNLVERDYFGLRFVDNGGQTHWVDLAKSLSSQLKGCVFPHKFYFCVKFYAADPCKLREEITRYLFFLQVKRDVLQGRLPVTFDEAGELCAYAVQSELGDFDPRVHTPGYVSEFCFVPNQTEDLEARIAAMHRRCVGATPLMAEHRFLEKAKWLKMYGVDLHPVQGESNVEYFLGLTPTGIVVYKHKSEVANYFWPRVTKATYKSKLFIIKVKDKNNDEHSYAFELSTKAACKHLWKCCVEHHAFFRHIQAKDKESRPTKVLRSLSNSSQRGRSERKALSDQIARQQPDVRRVPSRRQPRRVNSDSRLNAEQFHDQRRSPDRMITMMGHPQPVRAPRHRSLPELQGRESPRSTKSAPWESRLDYGLYTSGHDSTSERAASQGRHPRGVSGSDSESGISQRKKYFPNRKGSDNESDGSTSRRRRREMDSDSGSEVSFTNSGQGRKSGTLTHKDHNRNDVHILYPFHDKENHRNGSIPSLHSAPAGDARQQRRRRRRSKSPGNTKRPPEELKQHIAFDLVDTEGMTTEELRDIPYTKVETKASLFRVKYSPKFRQKIWQSRRKSFGEFDNKNQERSKNITRQDSRNTDPAGAYGGYTTHGSSMDEKPPPYNSVRSPRGTSNYNSGPDYSQSGYESHGSHVSSRHHQRPPPLYHVSSPPKTNSDSDPDTLVSYATSRGVKSDIVYSRNSQMHDPLASSTRSAYTSNRRHQHRDVQRNSGYLSSPQNGYNESRRQSRPLRDSEPPKFQQKPNSSISETPTAPSHRYSVPPSSSLLSPPSYGSTSHDHPSSSSSPHPTNVFPNHTNLLSPSSASNIGDSHGSRNPDMSRLRSNQSSRSSPSRPNSAGELHYGSYGKELRQQSHPPSNTPQNPSTNVYHNPVYFNNDNKVSATSPHSFHRYDRHASSTHERPGFSPQNNYDRANHSFPSLRNSQFQNNSSTPQHVNPGRNTATRNLYHDFQDAAMNQSGREASSSSPSRVSVGVTADSSQLQTPPRYRSNPPENSHRGGSSPRYSRGNNMNERSSYHQDRNMYDRYGPSSNNRYDISPRTPPRRSDQQWGVESATHMRGHSAQSASSSGYSGSHSRQSGSTPSGPSPLQSQSGGPYRPSHMQSSQSPYQQRSSQEGGYHSSHMSGRKPDPMHRSDQYSRGPPSRSHRSDLVTEL